MGVGRLLGLLAVKGLLGTPECSGAGSVGGSVFITLLS